MGVNRIIAGVAVVSLAALTAACGSSSHASSNASTTTAPSVAAAPTSTTPSTHYVIGYSNPQGTQPVLNNFGQALAAAGAREGIQVKSLNAALSVSNQVADIQQFINEKVNAIVVFPLAAQALVPVLTQARKAGIVVLGYNAVVTDSVTSSSLYPYNADLNQGILHQGAKLLADYVVGQLHGSGSILGVVASAPVPALHAFLAAEQKYATTGNPGIHWLETASDATDDIAGAASSVADALTKYHNNVNAIMGYFDGAAIGAAQSLKSAGASAITTGQQGNTDGISAVQSGQISATIDLAPYKQAVIALKMVTVLLAGQSVPTVVHPPVTLITKSNVGSYVPWSQGLSEVQNGTIAPPSTITANMNF